MQTLSTLCWLVVVLVFTCLIPKFQADITEDSCADLEYLVSIPIAWLILVLFGVGSFMVVKECRKINAQVQAIVDDIDKGDIEADLQV